LDEELRLMVEGEFIYVSYRNMEELKNVQASILQRITVTV
jgi:hypothetical protein